MIGSTFPELYITEPPDNFLGNVAIYNNETTLYAKQWNLWCLATIWVGFWILKILILKTQEWDTERSVNINSRKIELVFLDCLSNWSFSCKNGFLCPKVNNEF